MKQVSIGGTGAGKTWDNMKFIKEVYSNPKNPNARKCLIYDVNEEHPDIKAIKPKDIPAFVKQQTIEIRRVIPRDDKTGRELGLNEKFELLSDIINNYIIFPLLPIFFCNHAFDYQLFFKNLCKQS